MVTGERTATQEEDDSGWFPSWRTMCHGGLSSGAVVSDYPAIGAARDHQPEHVEKEAIKKMLIIPACDRRQCARLR